MSPEQARGTDVDFRSDQFSLGTLLYEMLAGGKPFDAASVPETLTAIIRDEPEPLEKRAPHVPAPVRWVVERLLAKEISERYDSTRDVVHDLKGLRDHLSTWSQASPADRTAGKGVSRWVPLAAGAVLLLILGAVVGRRMAPPPLSPFLGGDGAGTAIYVQDVVPGADTSSTRRKLATFEPDVELHSFALAPDMSFAVVAARQATSNLLEIDGLPPEVAPASPRRP
jgi:hypothetical protein